MQRNKKAIVIGTGIGGAGIAAQLAQAGFHVTVFERSAFSGGKTSSYSRDGFTMDIAVHTSPRCEKGPIGDLCNRLNVNLRWMHKEPSLRLHLGNQACSLHQKFWLPQYAIRAQLAFRLIPTPVMILGLSRFAWKILRIRTIEDIRRYEGMSAQDILKADVKNPRLYAMMEAMTSLMMVISSKEASAADFLWNLSNWLKKSNTGYPKGGYGVIPDKLLDVCRRHGGVVKLGEPVEHIRIKDDCVVGVETKNGFHSADLVVSNAGFKKTVHLAGTENFEKDFVERADNLKDSLGSVVVQYAVDKKIVNELVTLTVPEGFDTVEYITNLERNGIVGEPQLYIVCPTIVDPGLAPEGKHIILVGASAPADLKYKEVTKKILDKIEDAMQRLYPELEQHTLWKVRRNIDFFAALGGRGAGEAIGLAQRYDQDGKNKPDPRLPVKGLYVVGADAGGTGIGTELAADSAIHVFDCIMEDMN